MSDDETRPRFGRVICADGTEIPLVFRPDPADSSRFLGVHAGDERPVRLRPGVRADVEVDVLGPGQSVAVEIDRRPS